MKLTTKQTDKIIEKLKQQGFSIVDMSKCPKWVRQPVISEEYFNELTNEVL